MLFSFKRGWQPRALSKPKDRAHDPSHNERQSLNCETFRLTFHYARAFQLCAEQTHHRNVTFEMVCGFGATAILKSFLCRFLPSSLSLRFASLVSDVRFEQCGPHLCSSAVIIVSLNTTMSLIIFIIQFVVSSEFGRLIALCFQLR